MASTPSDINRDYPADSEAEINRLRTEMNAVILAHHYQEPELQDIADFVGDSLDLSRKAAETDADVIVFCGVKFMADVAHILSPKKLVLLPDMEAGCSLAGSSASLPAPSSSWPLGYWTQPKICAVS